MGPEVRDAFLAKMRVDSAFAARGKKFLADICQLARQRLANTGVLQHVYGGGSLHLLAKVRLSFSYRRATKTRQVVWQVLFG